MADDPISALAGIRHRASGASALSDIAVLLAAIEAAFRAHWQVTGVAHGTWCGGCYDRFGGHPDWPCPEYEAILTVLTGGGKAGA